MVSDDTFNEGDRGWGWWALGHGCVLGRSNLLLTARPEPLLNPTTPSPTSPTPRLPASCPVPCSDTAVINVFGKDDDNNDHN